MEYRNGYQPTDARPNDEPPKPPKSGSNAVKKKCEYTKGQNVLIIKTNSELKSNVYEKTYGLLESMVNNGVLLLDNRFDYEVVKIDEVVIDKSNCNTY